VFEVLINEKHCRNISILRSLTFRFMFLASRTQNYIQWILIRWLYLKHLKVLHKCEAPKNLATSYDRNTIKYSMQALHRFRRKLGYEETKMSHSIQALWENRTLLFMK